MRKILAILAVLLVVLTGCESDTKKDAPEPTPDNIINGTNTQVIRMPDGFRNVAFSCYGTVGMYVTSRGWIQGSVQDIASLPSSIAVLENDPHCKR